MTLSPRDAGSFVEMLLAGAAGDAIGLPFEGAGLPGVVELPAVWRASDDTRLSLATARALLDEGCVVPERVAEELLAEFRRAPIPGLGSSTLGALLALEQGQDWRISGTPGDKAAGNGAAMRCIPLAWFLDPTTSGGRRAVLDVARITHRNDEAVTGALAVVLGAWHLRGGIAGKDLLRVVAADLPDTLVRERIELFAELAGSGDLQSVAATFGSSGYVVESVPLALLVGTRDWDTLEEALLAVVGLGGDTDTNASMVGQLLAARGYRVPSGWVPRMELGQEIEALTD